ncbi:MAG TPA: hypothetical protein VG964_03905 [Candidatus Saccharimonadales bacterium]|nr:hypothetical protein [Candidatus Saccharimonadales bacterium]
MGNEQDLQALRSNILEQLVGMSDVLLDSDSTGYEALIALSRSTGNIDFLKKAFQKIDSQESGQEKADALLDLLEEVDFLLSRPAQPEEEPQETDDQDQADDQEGQITG